MGRTAAGGFHSSEKKGLPQKYYMNERVTADEAVCVTWPRGAGGGRARLPHSDAVYWLPHTGGS